MYYLIIDTCVWINLGKEDIEVREKISALVNQEKIRLIVPQFVIEEQT
jgi:rRNA-processing protein FCF1